jgi:hypothetical protein
VVLAVSGSAESFMELGSSALELIRALSPDRSAYTFPYSRFTKNRPQSLLFGQVPPGNHKASSSRRNLIGRQARSCWGLLNMTSGFLKSLATIEIKKYQSCLPGLTKDRHKDNMAPWRRIGIRVIEKGKMP